MDDLNFVVLGLGNAAAYAALALALVVAYRGSGTVNFATGAVALYAAYTYALLREGELLIPVPGLPGSIEVADELPFAVAFGGATVASALLGGVLHIAVFRHLRMAPPVARAVASVGVMLAVQAVLALRLGTTPRPVPAIFPTDVYELSSLRVPASRLWTFVAIVVVAAAVALLYRATRFGLATAAVAETEVGAFVSGVSADRIAGANWILSSVIAGIGGILIAPIVSLLPVAYSSFIVPALAAALAGRFGSIWWAVAASTAIGLTQSELTHLTNSVGWLAELPLSEMMPLVVIVSVLLIHGSPLPARGTLLRRSIGVAPRPRRFAGPAGAGAATALALLVVLDGGYRAAFITSLILAVLMLSFVVVTGFVGQISLAQLALAGVGAFAVSGLSTHWGVPFPLAPLAAATFAALIGLLVGLPSLWVRGYSVAIATLALAGGLDAVWFRNNRFNGGAAGARPVAPEVFGLDLQVGRGQEYPRVEFGLLCLVVLLAVTWGVALLRRSRWGEAMIAVSANERSAAASGVRVRATKCLGFALAAGIAGLAGALLAYQQTSVSADSYAPLAGLLLFATAYLAGITTISGAVLGGLLAPGGIVVVFADRYLEAGRWLALIAGVGLVMTVIMHPDGVIGFVHGLAAKRRRRRTSHGRSMRKPPAAVDGAVVHPLGVAGGPRSGQLLTVDAVGVTYGSVVALRDVSLSIASGQIVGFIGPNGAGKTTLIDAISGFVPHAGRVELDGHDLAGFRPHERARKGLVRTFQGLELYEGMTVAENIDVGEIAQGRRGARSRAPTDSIVSLLGLGEMRERPVGELSHGHRQLVAVARALAGAPSMLLLDEPAAGLERSEIEQLAERLRAIRRAGVTVGLIDHDIDFVLALCDEVHVFDIGERIVSGPPDVVRAHPRVIDAYLGISKLVDDEVDQTPPAAIDV